MRMDSGPINKNMCSAVGREVGATRMKTAACPPTTSAYTGPTTSDCHFLAGFFHFIDGYAS